MTDAISDNRKKRGRPKVGATLVGVRIEPRQLEVLDRWRLDQEDQPSRPEAVRRLMERGLGR